jgi:hypothetical protein
MHEKLEKKTEESINKILEEGINTNNLEHLYKLTKINHIAKEEENMNNYGNYGARRPGYDSYGEYGRGSYGENYGEYGNYGRRGRDMKYRGDDSLDRMSGEYGRYMESRNRYGAGSQESDRSFHYMVKALEDFIMVLKEEAESPEQKQQLMQSLQNSMR